MTTCTSKEQEAEAV